jgi:UDP-2-acetamido-3-amino-2,3-dideoxy-glucuronate N-acetyltransferase
MGVRSEPTADVDGRAVVGDGTVIWHLAQVRESARLGKRCVVGRGAYVDADVVVGDDVKIQNFALLYGPARVADGAFLGPAAVLTNDRYPRSIAPDGVQKRSGDWDASGVTIGKGASVGARSLILGGVDVGEWAMVAAGAIVTRDVPAYALVMGAPARRIAWVGPAGRPLVEEAEGDFRCPETGARFLESEDGLRERR